MPISSGTRLGPYEIVAPIGAGGMGEVYKARDTRLDRTVAVKVLPAEFASNAQFKVRFEREARTISQLSHPNICTLYDVGDNYLVMELLDGETLADRLTKGALPLADVFKFGVQIAEALGKAHREGVIHRDLKPGNVMLTKSGAKLLDFGLAKSNRVVESDKTVTQEGTVLGTIQYMAPEQLAGEEPDARSDIFALGAVLYEMTTGKRAFEGKTRTSVVSAIMAAEPRPVAEVQPLTPPALDHIIRRCLAKDRDDRWQSALDIAEELRWIAEERRETRTRRSAVWPAVAIAALIVAVAAATYVMTRQQRRAPVIISEINVPDNATFDFESAAAVLSPDGENIVFLAKPADGSPVLWIRRLDSPAALPLRGTENAVFPFWSPDGKSIGFFADGKLKRIDAAGGVPDTIASASSPRGGAWGSSGIILYAPSPPSPLLRVPASGGEPQQATVLDVMHGQTSHRFPAFLPDGRHFLYYVQGLAEGNNVFMGSLDSKEAKSLLRSDSGPVFAPPDFVLFMRGGTLDAQKIDMKRFEMIGDPVRIRDGIETSSTLNHSDLSASNNGIIAYTIGAAGTLSVLKFFDKHGAELGAVGTAADQLDPRISRDGGIVAASRFDGAGVGHIWAFDLRRNIETRLTATTAAEWAPVWSPDGKSVVYTSFDVSPGDLFVRRIDGSGSGALLFADRRRKIPTEWTADGRYIIYNTLSPGWDIEAYSIPEKKVVPLVTGPAAEVNGHLSPDQKWLAYTSDESGIAEVYVQQFPAATNKFQISGGGGVMPLWSRDGRELYFWQGMKLMAAAVHTEHGFVADAPHELFETRLRNFVGLSRNQYDITPDDRFLVNVNVSQQPNRSITLVQNWAAKLQ